MKLFLLFLFPCLAWAAQAPDFSVKVDGGFVVATPPPDHHFNFKAPIELWAGDRKLVVKRSHFSAKVLELAIPAHEKPTAVSAFLCDDKLTFCEKHKVSLAGAPQSSLPNVSPDTPSADVSPSAALQFDAEGFIDNQPDQALALARRQGKPLMIDFYGIWCPPCNELDEEVFNQSDFKKRMKKFVLLKLDADASLSWKLKSRYKVGGYPTLVFATSQGDEITRIVGFRRKEWVLKQADEAFRNRNTSFEELKSKADAGDESSADRVGQIYYERGEWDLAIRALAKSQKKHETYLLARIEKSHAALPAAAAEFEGAALKYLQEFDSSPEALDVREKLAEYYDEIKQPEKKRDVETAQVKATQDLVAHPKRLVGYDAEVADVYESQAEAYDSLGQKEAGRAAWANAAREYRRKKPATRERGFNLELAYALRMSGDIDSAEKIYQGLEGVYPKEFTFFFADANLNYAIQRFPEAVALSQKAYDFGYGDNKLRAAKVLAESLSASGKKPEAKTLLAQAIAETGVPDDPSIRTNRYLKALKDLQSSL
jgi:thiol-disulfide isomerase/thioredoxin